MDGSQIGIQVDLSDTVWAKVRRDMAARPSARELSLQAKNRTLSSENTRLESRNAQLRAENRELKTDNRSLEQEVRRNNTPGPTAPGYADSVTKGLRIDVFA